VAPGWLWETVRLEIADNSEPRSGVRSYPLYYLLKFMLIIEHEAYFTELMASLPTIKLVIADSPDFCQKA
jgi:hypothetical protein